MIQHEKRGHDSYADPADNPFERLEMILHADAYRLKQLTGSTEPLTVERLTRIDPDLADTAENLADSDIKWPDEASAVLRAPHDARLQLLTGEDADMAFIVPIIATDMDDEILALYQKKSKEDDWAKGYNNFFLNIGTKHQTASPEATQEFLKGGDMLGLTYGTKPYVERAHALLPEFMDALQHATKMNGGMEQWNDAMVEGYLEDGENTEKAVLLKASRMAYVLLARLLRQDDAVIQKAMLGFSLEGTALIKNPAAELRT